MRLDRKKIKTGLAALVIMLLTVVFAAAQEDTTPKKKLRSGAAVTDMVGGEGHGSYVIRVRKGQTLNVQISRRVPKGGNFNLTVSRSANFFNAEGVKFGRATSSRKWLRWTGRASASGNYYVYLTGFAPDDPHVIRYTLTVTVK